MQTHTITTYSYEELSEQAQKNARNWYREHGLDYEWYDSVYEDAKMCAALVGIEIDRIYFSGFWSQGDGACFEGAFTYKPGLLKAIKEYAPNDRELLGIAKELQKVRYKGITATVKHSGRYYHEMCTNINVYLDDGYVNEDIESEITDLLRDFMRWIYKRLEMEYEYLSSDESVAGSILANNYEFTEDGKIY